ncbi:MAG TPA: phage head closure protein [Candidatus Blautia avistercoris]|nr:phage head closure protein [Candidatus Blautia avistercoris]
MWNHSISLPAKKKEVQDPDGFKEQTYEFVKNIPASFTDVTRQDEILASQKGYTVNQNVEIAECNYNRESWLVDESDGAVYDIRRVYKKDKSMSLILSCERR